MMISIRSGLQGSYEFMLNRFKEQILMADRQKDQACVDMTIPAGAVQWGVRDLQLPGGALLNAIT